MSGLDAYRIKQLEKKVEALQKTVEKYELLLAEATGMSKAAKWGLRFLLACGGIGTADLVLRFLHWMNMPLVMGK